MSGKLKMIRIAKNEEIVDFIDNNQRKYYSVAKQAMEEINKFKTDVVDFQTGDYISMSKEILDRKNLTLRKVLSSIPIKKLEKMVYEKDKCLQIARDKLNPINERFSLKKTIKPVISDS